MSVRTRKSISTGSDRDQPRKRSGCRLNSALHGLVDWLVAGTDTQPSDIQDQLLHQSLAKTKTLFVAVVASSLLATVVAVISAAPWAYAWVLAEVFFGGIRLALMHTFLKAEAAGRNRSAIAPILAGLVASVIENDGNF
jgi:hypothetical protein